MVIIMEKSISDLKINGHGSSTGGKYNSVVINGNGSINGDMECIYLRINGQGNIKGNAKAESFKINGNSSIKGNLESEKVKVNGMAHIEGNLSVEDAETYGNINVGGDCNAEMFRVDGMFAVEGLLNAGELKLNLHGPSRAREIGGEKITVKRMGRFGLRGLKNFIWPHGHDKGLNADVIEGDDVYLENTQAKVVRGNNVELGPDCEIELVEYNETFKQDEKAEVGDYRQI